MKKTICHLNKEVWIPDIEESIKEWCNFISFCDEYEDKLSAVATVMELLDLLYLVKTDSLTNQQFDRLRFLVCD